MSRDELSVCLQINVAPSDLRYVCYTIPHQLAVFADQVDEIQFTLDTRPQKKSKYYAALFEENLFAIRQQLKAVCARHPHAYVREIDYSESKIRSLSEALRISEQIPTSALNGSPFYGYLFGIYEARSDYVLHIDADMLFGGASKTWVSEAVAVLKSNECVLVVNPLAGPPTQSGGIAQKYVERLSTPFPAFTFDEISTRIILANRRRLLFDYPIPIIRARGTKWLMALVNGMPAFDALEVCLSAILSTHCLLRLDMMGEGDGLWTLHPPYRSERFYERLPEIIAQIEKGEVPEKQRGDYDLNDSMIDWTDARRNRMIGRLRRYLGFAPSRLLRK